jgi:hypothetical protein
LKGKIMKKLLVLFLLFSALVVATSISTDIQTGPNTYWWTGAVPQDKGLAWMKEANRILEAGAFAGTGNIFYVDSGATGNATGLTWKDAVVTINAAVALCTENAGDVILVAQGHNEAVIAADGIDFDVAGITVLGCGDGTLMPTIDFDNADGEVVIGAANVTIINLRFNASVTDITHCIDVENAGDYAKIIHCYFPDGEAPGTDEFVDTIQVGTTATDVTISYCYYFSTGTGSNNFVDLSAATIVNPTVTHNIIYGAFAEAGIWAGAAVPTNCNISYNTVTNTTSSQFGIEFAGAATGVCAYNVVSADSSYEIDEGSMATFSNSSDWTFDLGTNNLDHLMKTPVSDDAGAIDLTEVVDKTVLSWILSGDGDTATFVPSTMALSVQATNLAAVLADTAAMDTAGEMQTLTGTAAISTTGVTGAPVANTLADTLHKDGSFTYDNTTDSLEAIADRDVTILADTAELQPVAEKCVSKTLTTIVSGQNGLFTIAGGPIKIIEIVGYVSTEIEGKSCLINYTANPTDPATDTQIGTTGTALEINADAIGTLYTWDGVLANNLTATTNGVALGTATYSGVIIPPGALELKAVVSTSATGAITFYMRYMPLATGVTVTAQ